MFTKSEIRAYYNDHNLRVLLRNYVLGNMRFNRAIKSVTESVPKTVKRILDVGCGIGHSTWLFKEAFPQARILGVDISDKSIEIAKKLFSDPKISFEVDDLNTLSRIEQFDLIVMIDVYEHIPRQQWPSLHQTLKNLISEDGWLVITTPTVDHQDFLKKKYPEGLQIVDENVADDDLLQLAREVGMTVVRFEKIAVWNVYDYQHFVVRKSQVFKEIPKEPPLGLILRSTQYFKRLLELGSVQQRRRRVQEVLGFDPLAQEQNGPRNEY